MVPFFTSLTILIYYKINKVIYRQQMLIKLKQTYPKLTKMGCLFSQKKYDRNQDNQQKSEYLYGVNPVLIALHIKSRNFQKLIVSNSDPVKLNSRVTNIINQAKQIKIFHEQTEVPLPIQFSRRQKMDVMVKGQPHQNVILQCSVKKYSPISIQDSNFNLDQHIGPGISIYADRITDPQNFGAIMRSSLYFGISQIIVGKKMNCPLNSTVSKASAGALQFLNPKVIKKNQQQFFKLWKKDNGLILSTDMGYNNNIPTIAVQNLKKQLIDGCLKNSYKRILVVMGSQGQGVSQHIANHADYQIQILRKGKSEYPFSLVDSLNVSTALCTILFELTK